MAESSSYHQNTFGPDLFNRNLKSPHHSKWRKADEWPVAMKQSGSTTGHVTNDSADWLLTLTCNVFNFGSNKYLLTCSRWHARHEIITWQLADPLKIHQWSLQQLLHTEFATLSWNAIWIKLLSYHEWAKRSMQPMVEDSESRTWWTMWHSCQFDGPHEAEMNDNRSGCWEPASQQACRSHLCLTKPICRPWWAWQTVSKQ